jgi:V8-like Glu-specific endopeptidase
MIQLRKAVESFNRPRVEEISAELLAQLRQRDGALSVEEAKRVLEMLQRKRYYQLLQRVADAMVHGGLDVPVVRRRYAQALLDQEVLTAGLAILEDLVAATTDEPQEHAEAWGLVGRAYKQLYVLTAPALMDRRTTFLERSIAAYHDVYAADPGRRWHGINTVALLMRAQADGIHLPGFPDPAEQAATMATRILDEIRAERVPDTWDRATALEACVALGRHDDALRWLDRYLDAPYTDAFELASTLRQLVEVWRLDATSEPGAELLPLLRAGLLQREGGQVTVPASDLERETPRRIDSDTNLERVFGAERFQSLRWFREALERCRAVVRIEDEFEEGIGTGFLVDGHALHPALPLVVLMTNAHVVPDTLAPQEAFVTFRGLETTAGVGERHEVQAVLWFSPREDLDATILSLKSVPAGVTPCPTARQLPPLDTVPPPRAYIVGHPAGRIQPMFSIQDNLMLDYDTARVHYRAPTEPGSSGSPVFDRYWKLIALHHAGSEQMPMLHGGSTYQANEGIWVGRIREALSAELAR